MTSNILCFTVKGELKIEKMKKAWLVTTAIISLRKYYRNIKVIGCGFRKTRYFLFSLNRVARNTDG